jgi:acetyl-CoA carboxylase / biotin carboxylase 1
VLDGKTVLLHDIFDPSELRSDITGKVVRYLHKNGTQLEAMKVTHHHTSIT